ncbi:YbaB/EbfC family nucleoid-associated protein [Amycolatopsis suaedae]|uniref:YbaB/EbfC family DNA-binding protein n=1 Tax=Amycolatopsis suaedae TaxID=2510978 RepID=A0A4Q7J8V5_9PSEU|nr:YbaB/EbfC family nucleoid-associated protein [Amycolatopsis suaedae]RZQ64151.1 YbaB/EbfC family DNA-binding protein [Amycolatopsis suaedae]
MTRDHEELIADSAKTTPKAPPSGPTALYHELGQVEATATSADESVTVVAGPGGTIKDIQLTGDAFDLPADELVGTLLNTVHEAATESVRRQAELVDEHTGDRAMPPGSLRGLRPAGEDNRPE